MARSRMATVVLAVAVAAVMGGCSAYDEQPRLTQAAFDARGAAVVAAWQQTPAAQAWRDGFVPLADLSIPPAGGFDPDPLENDVLRAVFRSGWFVTVAPLPTDRPAPGTVRFPDGATMTVPLVSADASLGAVRRPNPHCGPPETSGPSPPSSGGWCRHLTITAVDLATTTLLTSRGTATVPAWRFAMAELREPVWRVAVAPSAITALPLPENRMGADLAGLLGAHDLRGADGTTLHLELTGGDCVEDVRALAYETDDAVVVGGSYRFDPGWGGTCEGYGVATPADVVLDRPLGLRPLLDGLTGVLLSQLAPER